MTHCGCSWRCNVLAGLVIIGILGCAKSPPAVATEPITTPPPSGVAVYALSKGRGVPEPTRAALGKIRELLRAMQSEQKVTHLDEKRMGLEGEVRVCAQFKDTATATAAIKQLQGIAGGVELLSIKEERCAAP